MKTNEFDLRQVIATVNMLRSVVKNELHLLHNKGMQHFFEKYPSLTSFTWYQYTPYFNDGDPCSFRLRASVYSLTMVYEGRTWEMATDIDSDNNSYNRAGYAIAQEISEFIETLGEDFLKEKYGDGYEITVTKDGATVNEYEHD